MTGRFIKNKKNLLLLILFGIFVISSNVLALEVAWPPSPVGTELTADSTLTELVKYLYEWGITLGGLAAFIALIIAGFLYLTSVGDPGKMKDAKDRAIWAIGGLVLLLASWLILHTINPQLTTLRPIKLDLEAIFTACDTNADCNKRKICDDKKPGDGKREGVCLPKMETPIGRACDVVEVYTETNFKGDYARILKKNECVNVTRSYFSSQGLIDGKECGAEPRPEGCPCGGYLKIFPGPGCKAGYQIGTEASTSKRWSTYKIKGSIKFIAF